MRARLVPKSTLLIGVAALGTTFFVSRGTHSTIHEFVAVVAMGLEVALVVCSGLGKKRAAAILLVAVVICWLTVFVTDSAYQKIADFLGRALSSCF